MRLSTLVKLGLALWFVCEGVVFVLIAEVIGYPEALLVAFITTLFGWTLLKRAGASAMVKLRAMMEGRLVGAPSERFMDDSLATIGAVALLVPGFLSDAIGLALAVPAARDRVARWIGGMGFARFRPADERGRTGSPSTIDLDPADWRRNDGSHGPISKA